MTNTNEQDQFRANLINSTATTPHGDLQALRAIHETAIKTDPRFYGAYAAWYAQKGSVRDHKEAFVAFLLTSEFEPLKEAGYVLLQELPIFQVERVINLLTSMGQIVRKTGRRSFTPRKKSVLTAIKDYMGKYHTDDEKFDRDVVRNFKSFKRIYAGLGLPVGHRQKLVLFDDNPPVGSLSFIVKQIAKEKDELKQAELLIENSIPFPIAVSLVKGSSPVIWAAFVENMSPQEVINNIGTIERRGLMSVPEIKKVVDAKLKQAQTRKGVSGLKANVASKAAGVSAETKAKLEQVEDTQIKAHGDIRRPYAVFIDKSGSMKKALEFSKRDLIPAVLGSAREGVQAYFYTFNTNAYPLTFKGKTVNDIRNAFQMESDGGGTAIGIALRDMIAKNLQVEQIVLVTDEGEVQSPSFGTAYREYVAKFGTKPDVIILRFGTDTRVEQALEKIGDVNVSVIQIDESKTDYYAIPNVLDLLSKGGIQEKIQEILNTPLPTKEEYFKRTEAKKQKKSRLQDATV